MLGHCGLEQWSREEQQCEAVEQGPACWLQQTPPAVPLVFGFHEFEQHSDGVRTDWPAPRQQVFFALSHCNPLQQLLFSGLQDAYNGRHLAAIHFPEHEPLQHWVDDVHVELSLLQPAVNGNSCLVSITRIKSRTPTMSKDNFNIVGTREHQFTCNRNQ